MAEWPAGYVGQGFSLRGEKDRFVLPSKLRNRITERSDQRILCIGSHERWPCMIGFGLDRVAAFPDILDREEEKAIRLGREFDRDMHMANLHDLEEVPFDASGRFILPAISTEIGAIGDALYFQGAGDFITIWNPDTLLAQDGSFVNMQKRCRSAMAEAEAKAKGKGK